MHEVPDQPGLQLQTGQPAGPVTVVPRPEHGDPDDEDEASVEGVVISVAQVAPWEPAVAYAPLPDPGANLFLFQAPLFITSIGGEPMTGTLIAGLLARSSEP